MKCYSPHMHLSLLSLVGPDAGELVDEDWSEVLKVGKLVSPKMSDRLAQIYILHRSYLTPERLAKFWPSRSPMCPKCLTSAGTFGHFIWHCPRVRRFWEQVVQFLHDQMDSPVTMDLGNVYWDYFRTPIWINTLLNVCMKPYSLPGNWWIGYGYRPQLYFGAWINEINITLP